MIYTQLLQPLGIDFRVYYESSFMLWHHLNPYRGILSSTFPLNYPPPVFLLIWPLGLFPQWLAGPIWNVGSVLAVILSVYFVCKIAWKKLSTALFLFLTFLFTIPYFPVKFNIGNGQINHYILLLCSASLFLYFRRRGWLSAFLLALAISVKLAPIIFLLYFFIQRDWKYVCRVLLLLPLIVALPLLFISWDWQKEYYLKILFWSFTLAAKDWYYNQSLEGFLARSFSSPVGILVSTYVLSGLIVFLTWRRGRKISWVRCLAAVASLYLLIHPIALQHYFGFALIPWILLLADFKDGGADKLGWGLLIFPYLILAGNIKTPGAVPREINFLISHQLFGILVLWLLALWKENIGRVVAILAITMTTITYSLVLLCRGGICL